MARHGVVLSAFFVQPEPPARTLRPKVLDLHFQRGSDTRERIGEGGNQRPVAQFADGMESSSLRQCRGDLRPVQADIDPIGTYDHLVDDIPDEHLSMKKPSTRPKNTSALFFSAY
jgi:hypothetical protein